MIPTTDTITMSLAQDIRCEHEAAQQAFASAVEHAVRCGELLAEAKAQVRHGEWLPWLAENFPASPRTAQGYMRLAAQPNAQALAHLGIEGALRQLAAPPAVNLDEAAELAEPRETPDPITAYIFACGDPIPPRYVRAQELMAARVVKQSWIDRHEYLRPPGDDQSIEAQLRWIMPREGSHGLHAIETGRACRLAAKVMAEITLIGAEIAELLPEVTGREWRAIERRAAKIGALLEARIAELDDDR